MIDVTLLGVWYAAVAYSLIRLMRILPGIKSWYEEGIKPIACNLCMSFWITVMLAAIVYLQSGSWEVCWGWPVGWSLASILLDWYESLRRAPPRILLPTEVKNHGND